MTPVSVLFVDDEDDIRFSFEDYFEDYFPLLVTSDGKEAMTVLRQGNNIGVVVTDIRMPEMNGLELIKAAREINPDLGFIVVSGHGDSDDIIQALRLGARNYLRKPYNFNELHQTIQEEVRRFQILKEESLHLEQEKAVEQYLVSVEGMTYLLPSNMKLVAPITFRLVSSLEAAGIIDETERGNVVLALIEIINNSIEHGNFEITGEEKIQLKAESENAYQEKLRLRHNKSPYKDRSVKIVASISENQAVLEIVDEGEGFDFYNLPDPTEPENLFLPSGRGILLARYFLDKVEFQGKGNRVVLVKNRKKPVN